MYITRADVEAVVPADALARALESGVEDGPDDDAVFASMLASVEREVDGYLAGRYALPPSPSVPHLLSDATLKLFCELAYRRQGIVDDQNPWVKQADRIRDRLAAVAAGDEDIPGMALRRSFGAFNTPSLLFGGGS